MDPKPTKLNRREAIKLVAAATASITVLQQKTFGAAATIAGQPYGVDPLLNKAYKSGDFWPLTLNTEQRATVLALTDLILPADDKSPAASEVGTVDFIDEWISAPSEGQRRDRQQILDGLAWLNQQSENRFSKKFADLTLKEQSAIADDICYLDQASDKYRIAAEFFATFRNLAAGGYYATSQGWLDIGYVGNLPTDKFEVPPQEVLKKLGL